MFKSTYFKSRTVNRSSFVIHVVLGCLLCVTTATATTGWNNLEPLKSRRADVERVLGRPVAEQPGSNNGGTLRFRTSQGTATVAFITPEFISAKKLAPELDGTVKQVVVQYDNSADTEASLGIEKKPEFVREARQNVVVYRNTRDGIAHTFIDGKLRTTYYFPSLQEWAQATTKRR